MSTRGQFSVLSTLTSSPCTSPSSPCWTTRGCFHAPMILLFDCGTCLHNRPFPPSPLTPTMSAPDKSLPLIHISSSPARMTALSASLIPAQANANFSWAQRPEGLALALCLSSKYSCTRRGPLLCLLQGPSFAYGTSLLVGDVSVQCQITKRRSPHSPLMPIRRGY